MAVRWCGNVKITVFWDDHGWYRGTVKDDAYRSKTYKFNELRPAPSLVANLAVDSKKAYDGAAAAIMSFYTNDLGDYTACEMNEDYTRYLIRRRKGGPVVCEAE